MDVLLIKFKEGSQLKLNWIGNNAKFIESMVTSLLTQFRQNYNQTVQKLS